MKPLWRDPDATADRIRSWREHVGTVKEHAIVGLGIAGLAGLFVVLIATGNPITKKAIGYLSLAAILLVPLLAWATWFWRYEIHDLAFNTSLSRWIGRKGLWPLVIGFVLLALSEVFFGAVSNTWGYDPMHIGDGWVR